MNYLYPACFYVEENDQYSVIFPDLGISTYGNNLEDAIYMATDLLCMWILDCKKDKTELPSPSNISDIKLDNEKGFVNIVVADIDAYTNKNKKAVKKTLSIPAWLNELAEREGVNFSQVLQKGLKEYLHLDA